MFENVSRCLKYVQWKALQGYPLVVTSPKVKQIQRPKFHFEGLTSRAFNKVFMIY